MNYEKGKLSTYCIIIQTSFCTKTKAHHKRTSSNQNCDLIVTIGCKIKSNLRKQKIYMKSGAMLLPSKLTLIDTFQRNTSLNLMSIDQI